MLALVVKMDQLLEALVTTLIFVFVGLLFFALAFGILGKATPFSIRKEIEEDQNVALGIVIGAIMLGIAIIIAAAIGG
jgi:putative membrane protein